MNFPQIAGGYWKVGHGTGSRKWERYFIMSFDPFKTKGNLNDYRTITQDPNRRLHLAEE